MRRVMNFGKTSARFLLWSGGMKSTDQTRPSHNPATAVRVRVAAADEYAWFDQQLADRRYLRAACPAGDYLRQIVEVHGRSTGP
jgi:glutathione S-transferase